ncbi:hypothetical protein B0H21DRAFT_826142 [Amylocystis lapponica]|nr:hypothetical protein B0H21DRAFT_826142 [Amylocystis lapponica]
MIQICRAEDGHVFELSVSLWDLERLESLNRYLEEKTGVPQDAVLAYLADGRRLRDDNIRDLAGVQDQTIYVFNKHYLELDWNQVLQQLWMEPPLQPPVEEIMESTPPLEPSRLASSYFHAAHTHNEHVKHTFRSIQYQHAALRIASSALDLHVLAIADVFDGISASATRELEKQASLLAGLDADLDIVARVTIHREFMSPAVRKAMEVGERGRTLGDYVSKVKMRQVADSCVKTHEELQARFQEVSTAMSRLSQGTDEVRASVTDQGLIEDAESCVQRSQEALDKLAELYSLVESPVSAPEMLLQDIRQLEDTLRSELQFVTQVKNSYTELCIGALRSISTLNNDLVELPPSLTSLQAGFKAKTSFAHIQRLHNMLYAYGATVVEIVRRKEFARFFYQRAQSILEVMAKLSANERKRRQVYRGDVHGLLPFETKGMEDPVPSIDFSPTGSLDFSYSLERADIDELLKVLNDLEHFATMSQDPAALGSVQEARAGLDRLISKMDSLESGFDRIAERSLLSASRLINHRRRSTEDDQAYADLELQVQDLRQTKEEQEKSSNHARVALEEEVTQVRNLLQSSEAARDQLERDLHSAKAKLESETTSRRVLEERNIELSSDADGNRDSLAQALAEATEKTKEAEFLRQQLVQARTESEDVKALEKKHADKVSSLLEEQALALGRLEDARARGEDLEVQIKAARTESDDVKRALADAGREKDRLLRAQASEHDRAMRDHIAEADGDRAVLEHQFSELKAVLDDTERQLKDARAQTEMALADTVGLREELQRVEHELREARHVERVLRDDLRTGRTSQSDYELQLEHSSRLAAQMLDVALAFRDSHVKALATAQAISSHPTAKISNSTHLADSGMIPGRSSVYFVEPPPIDPSDPTAALEALRAFDHDHFLEAINKTGSTIRKWQKQCKEYRERAKGKISFRNFAKGDLALFLPTRNSVSKPWAAFNVSFPHYFLQATGHLAEQLKTREWIVARITSITERVVDHKDPSTNPYGLGDGVKYYMLEVEDWTQPAYPSNKRRESSRKTSSEVQAPVSPNMEAESTLPPGPPENEVEDSFSATRPPTSRLFPMRARANSSPTAGPSSLSRLLAQAPPAEPSSESVVPPHPRTPSPLTLNSQPPPSPPETTIAPPAHHGHTMPSPLRPGSRASRVSSSSRFSGGRIPFGTSGTTKAVATTAISEQAISSAGSSGEVTGAMDGTSPGSSVPSPEGSPPGGMSHLVSLRRRTTSYHVPPRNPPLATSVSTSSPFVTTFGGGIATGGSASSRLASLASSWGVSFGRKRRSEVLETGVDSPLRDPASSTPVSRIFGDTSPIPESPTNSGSE